MNFLKSLQEKPERIRKRIFWLVMVIVMIGVIFLFFQNIEKSISSFPENIEELGGEQKESVSTKTNIDENISGIKKGIEELKKLLEEVKKVE